MRSVRAHRTSPTAVTGILGGTPEAVQHAVLIRQWSEGVNRGTVIPCATVFVRPRLVPNSRMLAALGRDADSAGPVADGEFERAQLIAVLVVLLPFAYRSAGGTARWILPSSIAVAALLLVGASSFVAPTDVTSALLAVSLIALLAWSIAFATLAAKTHRHG